MSRFMQVLVIAALAAALAGCSKPKSKEDAGVDARLDADVREDGAESKPCPPATIDPSWSTQASSTVEHVIDGQFGPGEWDHAIRLEGAFTDLYLDYQAPYLYALNDWRVNVQGIRSDCFNEFNLTGGAEEFIVKVFGDGEMTIEGAELDGDGAYSLSSSPNWSRPHTIYEFRLLVPETVAICLNLCDPALLSNCEHLTTEPVSFAIRTGTLPVRVARVINDDVTILAEGAACGYGEGICGDGLSCVEDGDSATCQDQNPPDPDSDGEDAGSSDVVGDVMDDPFHEDVDFPDEPSPDADPDGPGEDGPWE